MKFNYVMFSLAITIFASSAVYAQDSCDADTVIQPAIDEAAASSACNLNGVYISADVLASNLSEKCTALVEEKCKKCLKEGGAKYISILKLLNRAGFLESSSIADLKVTIKAIDCSTGGSDPKDSDGEDNQPGHGDKKPGDAVREPVKTPTPLPTSAPTTKPTEKLGLTRQEARAKVELNCPCQSSRFTSHEQFLYCAIPIVNYMLDHHLIAQELATSIKSDLSGSSCGV